MYLLAGGLARARGYYVINYGVDIIEYVSILVVGAPKHFSLGNYTQHQCVVLRRRVIGKSRNYWLGSSNYSRVIGKIKLRCD